MRARRKPPDHEPHMNPGGCSSVFELDGAGEDNVSRAEHDSRSLKRRKRMFSCPCSRETAVVRAIPCSTIGTR